MRTRNITREVFNTLQIGTDAKGGYLVPDEYQRTLIEALEDQNIIRRLAHVITTSSGDTQIPVVASKGSASWIQEEAQYVESDNTFGLVTLGAFKLATIMFGDLSYYWIADRTTRTFKRLDELYAATGQVGFLGSERVDGKLVLPEAVKVMAMKKST